jgi:hypothetical protein
MRRLCNATRMFDVVVIAEADAEPAARSLATLVEGVVDGMLRRAVLLSSAENDGLRGLADAAGCRLVAGVPAGGFGAALTPHLETPHVLALAAGALLPPGWPELLRQAQRQSGAPAEDMALAFRPAGLAARLRLRAAIIGRARLPLTHGALVPRASLTARDFNGVTIAPLRARLAVEVRVERASGW